MVNWFETIAFCRWLSHRLGDPSISLPTEQQWERAAAGRQAWMYPSSATDYVPGHANVNETGGDNSAGSSLARTTAVGLYPAGASAEGGVHDLAGNVWEWCLNEYKNPANVGTEGDVPRVLRGGSWSDGPSFARASFRNVNLYPGYRDGIIGIRVCRASPIGPLDHGAADR
jgi:formylglycine-generating enzyme required for sulfatase activity